MKRVLRSQHDYISTLLRNQLTSLVLYEAITTTRAKARVLAAFANHFLARLESDNLTSTRLAHQTLLHKNAVKKVFEEILPRYGKTATSYARVLRVMPRKGDSAEMSLVMLQKPLTVKETKTAAEPKTVTKTVKKAAKKVVKN